MKTSAEDRPPAALPSGTVTFLLTDVERSSRIWETQPSEMRQALIQHDRLIEKVVAQHDGVLVRPRGEGDSRFAVFTQATTAVAAACAMQVALYAHAWPTSEPVRVRIALHTGEADERDGDYYGPAINRCARLRTLASGGQTLLSAVTAELVLDRMPVGADLSDLGTHRLKDLLRPEHVFQVCVTGLPSQFPPLTGLDTHPHNLPVQLTPFIGRERELTRLHAAVLQPDVRLVTLTGPGGVGKTRLAIQAAADVLDLFEDGIFVVQLAAITDYNLVIRSVAHVLGLRETANQPLVEQLIESLRTRRMLLILDNFEQVLPAAPAIASLLAACPGLKFLVTSRAVLRVSGEHDFAVTPLALPPELGNTQSLEQYDAIRLFVDRARATRQDFALTAENAALIAAICRRVDGLPLSIELAAARVRHAPLLLLLERLKRSLDTLTAGNRDAPARQRTLRDTLAWSYALLEPAEQRFFRRMSVFVGGCSPDAAQAVCTDPDESAFDLLGALVDKSLVSSEEHTLVGSASLARYTMLETVREYAFQQLAVSHEVADTRNRHAQAFLELAELAEPMLSGSGQSEWVELLELEHANLRAALAWADSTGNVGISLRLGASLARFWWRTGFLAEGQRWLEQALGRNAGDSLPGRARALTAAGVLAWWRGDHALAQLRLEESIELHRSVGDNWGTARAVLYKGRVAFDSGDVPAAEALFQESLMLFRVTGDEWGAAGALNNLGEVARLRSDYPAARQLYEDSLARLRTQGDTQNIAVALLNLGLVAMAEGQVERAAELFGESLGSVRERSSGLVADCLDGLAGVANARGRVRQAVRLFGAADALRQRIGAHRATSEQEFYARELQKAMSAPDLGVPAEIMEEGRALSLEAATSEALAEAILTVAASPG